MVLVFRDNLDYLMVAGDRSEAIRYCLNDYDEHHRVAAMRVAFRSRWVEPAEALRLIPDTDLWLEGAYLELIEVWDAMGEDRELRGFHQEPWSGDYIHEQTGTRFDPERCMKEKRL